jgi:hypothetical protein
VCANDNRGAANVVCATTGVRDVEQINDLPAATNLPA